MCNKIAILIDSENISHLLIKKIFNFIDQHDTLKQEDIIIRYAYGDWSSNALSGKSWRDVLIEYGIKPVQAIQYRAGKNSADILLCIDAMELLFKNEEISTFILATNDSDFTSLVSKLKENSKYVIGFSENKQVSKSLFKIFNEYEILGNEYKEASMDKELFIEINDKVRNYLENNHPSKRKIHNIEKDEWAELIKFAALTYSSRNEGQCMELTHLNGQLKEFVPNFSFKELKYSKLVHFIKDNSDFIDIIEKDLGKHKKYYLKSYI
tara:strand:+ start:36984 stop:37784 length:801 start_codon:yes stop_codon:yes gene_type:complete